MRILCAIGPLRGRDVARAAASNAREGDELVLVHVIDEGPRRDLDMLRGPLHPHHGRGAELDAAEDSAGKAALKEAAEEAARRGLSASPRLERGNPEQTVVRLAAELDAAVVVLAAREAPGGHPLTGPPSVGHTARFILDHSPVNVLMIRGASTMS